MNCFKCNTKMQKGELETYWDGDFVTKVTKRIEGFFKSKVSAVDCFVCPNCGYIELKALEPEIFKE